MKRLIPIAIAGLGAANVGCAGGVAHVRADHARYVVSMSDGVRGADGKVLPDVMKQKVGDFTYDFTNWAMLWHFLPLSSKVRDLSDEINQQVEKAGGNAVTNLKVKIANCKTNSITLLGILPGCVDVMVSGTIAKVTDPSAIPAAAPSAAPAAAPPAAPAPAPAAPTASN